MDPYRVEAEGFTVNLPCRRCGNEADPELTVPVRPVPTPLCPPCYVEWSGQSFEYFEWWRMQQTSESNRSSLQRFFRRLGEMISRWR